ncbi:hypothetical protein [Roseateles sp.]|uniref:hypothetical protein n=1 Tax=Roseateles sp. TaxID=1971397 RepID=UPI003BA8F5D8
MGVETSPNDPAKSLDDQIKELQREKLQREIRQLRGLTFESLAKLSVAVLGIVAASWAVGSGAIKAQLDLIDTREKLVAKNAELTDQANKLAMQTTELHRRSAEIEEKQKELTDLDARKALLADEYSRLQTTVRHINDGSQQLSPAAPGKGKQALKDELTQASKPIVFVQFAGSLNRDATIKPLLQALNASGFNAPGAQRINKNQTNEVRYFANTDFERAAAAKVASIAQDTFAKLGCPLPTLTAKLVQREDGKTSPTELWLMHSCEAKP